MRTMERVLLLILALCIIGMTVVTISKAMDASRESDALIARCDAMYERGRR